VRLFIEPVEAVVSEIQNPDVGDLWETHAAVTFRTAVRAAAEVDAVFDTSVSVIHRINDRTMFVIQNE